MMQIRLVRNVRLGLKNLALHALRSVLTTIGVILGVGSVVAMLAVAEGASKSALEQIRKLGSNNIIIQAMKSVEEEQQVQSHSHLSVYGLLYEDERRIRDIFPEVQRVVPAKEVRKEGRLSDQAMELRVVGTIPDWFELVQRPLIAGRIMSSRDMQERGNVVVLTEYGARRLLATYSSIGQSLRIGRDYFEVVGIVKSETTQAGGLQTPDKEVDAYVPLNVARERFGDIASKQTSGGFERERVELHLMIVEVKSLDHVESVASGIEAMLKRFHNKADYRMSVPLALLHQAEATKRTMNLVLGSIAGISLVVGGVGIMNIMLASVTERTREIGIRRAIGAKRRQIVIQFLIETTVLSTLGGVLGIAVGMILPRAITWLWGMPTVITLYSLILSFGISMLVGLIFGIYPAFRASALDPIVALRHE